MWHGVFLYVENNMSNARNLANIITGNYDIPSGALDNAIPADGSITAAKLASSLDLTSKTVSLPLGVGGAWVRLAGGDISGEIANISYSGFTPEYDHYVFVAENFGSANTGSVASRLRLKDSSGTTLTGSYYRWISSHPYVVSSGGLHNVHAGWNDQFFGIHGSNGSKGGVPDQNGLNGVVHFYRPADASKRTYVTFHTTSVEQADDQHNCHIGSGVYTIAGEHRGFEFFFSTDNIRTGSYAIYGVKNT
jgi:hypothetical protein